jgi:hypothetical protein
VKVDDTIGSPAVLTFLDLTIGLTFQVGEGEAPPTAVRQRDGSLIVDLPSSFDSCMTPATAFLNFFPAGKLAFKLLPKGGQVQIFSNFTAVLYKRLRAAGFTALDAKHYINGLRELRSALVGGQVEFFLNLLDAKICRWTWRPDLRFHLYPDGHADVSLHGSNAILGYDRLDSVSNAP